MAGWRLRRLGGGFPFKASLKSVVEGSAGHPYSSPREFFKATYITDGVRRLLSAAWGRLSGVEDAPPGAVVFGPGGWGKTHSLIALDYMASNPEVLLEAEDLKGAIGGGAPWRSSRTVVFDASSFSPGDLRRMGYPNLWSFIMAGLGSKGVWGEPPSTEDIAEALEAAVSSDGAAVIIVDGVDSYMEALVRSGLGGEASGLTLFLERLGDAIAGVKRCFAAFSISGRMRVEDLPSLRWAEPLSPAEPGDLGGIALKLLFEHVDDGEAEEVSRTYDEAYRSWGVSGPSWRDMRSSYPLHPTLISWLAEAAASSGSISWALKLLLEAAKRVEGSSDFILPGDVDATDPKIADALLYLAPRLRAAVGADSEVIRRMEGRVGIIASLAYSTVTLRTIAGRPASEEDVILGSASPLRGVGPRDVKRALETLLSTASFLHEETLGGSRRFMVRSRANIQSLVRRRAVRVLEERRGEAAALIADRLKYTARTPGHVSLILWPRTPESVPDDRKLKLVLGNPALAREFHKYASSLASSYRGSWRRYTNTVLILRPEPGVYERLLEHAAIAIAAREVLGEAGLSDEDRRALRSIESEALKSLSEEAPLMYTEVFYPVGRMGGAVELASAPLDAYTALREGLWSAARKALQGRGKLYINPQPPLILDVIRSLGSASGVAIQEIVEYILSNPGLPMFEQLERSVEDAVRRLMSMGALGLAREGRVECGRPNINLKTAKVAPCDGSSRSQEASAQAPHSDSRRATVAGGLRGVTALLSAAAALGYDSEVEVTAAIIAGGGEARVSYRGPLQGAIRLMESLMAAGLTGSASVTLEEGEVLPGALEAAYRVDSSVRIVKAYERESRTSTIQG